MPPVQKHRDTTPEPSGPNAHSASAQSVANNPPGLEELQIQVRKLLSAQHRRSAHLKLAARCAVTSILLGVLGYGGVALAEPESALPCSGEEHLYCFEAGAPAVAAHVNHNFIQLKAWLEEKVGGVGSDDASIGGSLSVSGSTNVKDLAVSDRLQVSGPTQVGDLDINGALAVPADFFTVETDFEIANLHSSGGGSSQQWLLPQDNSWCSLSHVRVQALDGAGQAGVCEIVTEEREGVWWWRLRASREGDRAAAQCKASCISWTSSGG